LPIALSFTFPFVLGLLFLLGLFVGLSSALINAIFVVLIAVWVFDLLLGVVSETYSWLEST
jgi:hypothetical protein